MTSLTERLAQLGIDGSDDPSAVSLYEQEREKYFSKADRDISKKSGTTNFFTVAQEVIGLQKRGDYEGVIKRLKYLEEQCGGILSRDTKFQIQEVLQQQQTGRETVDYGNDLCRWANRQPAYPEDLGK